MAKRIEGARGLESMCTFIYCHHGYKNEVGSGLDHD